MTDFHSIASSLISAAIDMNKFATALREAGIESIDDLKDMTARLRRAERESAAREALIKCAGSLRAGEEQEE